MSPLGRVRTASSQRAAEVPRPVAAGQELPFGEHEKPGTYGKSKHSWLYCNLYRKLLFNYTDLAEPFSNSAVAKNIRRVR